MLISKNTAKRYLKEMDLRSGAIRTVSKERNQEAFEQAGKVIDALARLDHEEG